MQVRPLLPAPRRSKVRFAPTLFFCKNTVIRPLPCSSSSAKRHACFGCSLASALTTPSLRYHLFAVCRLRRFMSQALYRLRRRFLFLGKRHLALSASQSSLCSVGMAMPTSARSRRHKLCIIRGGDSQAVFTASHSRRCSAFSPQSSRFAGAPSVRAVGRDSLFCLHRCLRHRDFWLFHFGPMC